MSDRRRFPRYRFEGTGGLTGAAEGTIAQVSVVSLSVDGCRVLGTGLPMRGARCSLVLQDKGKEFTADCEITWHGDDVAGLKFIAVDEQNLEVLRQICKNLNLEPLAPPRPMDPPSRR